MTTKLDEKIQKIESKIPGITEKLETQQSNFFDCYNTLRVLDVQLTQTDNYDVAVARWGNRHFTDSNHHMSGIGEDGWLEVYARLKNGGEIIEYKTLEQFILSRDDRARDRVDLVGFRYASIEHLSEDIVGIAWSNEDGQNKFKEEVDVGSLTK
tara:strand:- start:336 stop:797 length:462 start_codon:yes stop_codon:yes gene_type:complete